MTRLDDRGGRWCLGRGSPRAVVAFVVCAVLAASWSHRVLGDEIIPLPPVDQVRPLPPSKQILPLPPVEGTLPPLSDQMRALPPVDEPGDAAPAEPTPASSALA